MVLATALGIHTITSLPAAGYEFRAEWGQLEVVTEIIETQLDCGNCLGNCGTEFLVQAASLTLGVDQFGASCNELEANGRVTGDILLKAYVDPATGEPLAKSQGGIAVCPVPGPGLVADFRAASSGRSHVRVNFGYFLGSSGTYSASLTVGSTVAALEGIVGLENAVFTEYLDPVPVMSLPLPFEMKGTKAGCNCSDGNVSYLYRSNATLVSTVPLRYQTLTPPGNDVFVDLPGEIDLEFESVSMPGDTWLLRRLEGPPLPEWMRFSGLPYSIYFQMGTSAVAAGGVRVCVDYDESRVVGEEGNLILYQYDTLRQTWVELPTFVDIVTNRVCATTQSLSIFILAEGQGVRFAQVQEMPQLPVGVAAGDYDADGDPRCVSLQWLGCPERAPAQ